MELTNRRVVITGAGRGIGRAIAIAMGRSGARLCLWGRTKCNLLETQDLVRSVGAEVEIIVADVSIASEVERAWQVVAGRWGGVDVLVNNAGVQGPMGPMHEINVEDWWRTVEINLRSTFLCSQTVLPGMIGQNRGKIINLSGGGAVTPRPFFSAYSASKAAIVRLTETLASEVKKNGIDVNAIAPGAVNTQMLDQRLAAGLSIGEVEREAATDLVQNGGIDLEKPAALAVFLASDKSNGLSGRLLSAVWDPWEKMDLQKVMETETFTMRRLNVDEESIV
ncbi:MAG: SDR family oxidoreductase [Candidatus Latescibacterota bacterium]|nr:SDR family oxidoreductase [Candidatus Latescibacterota bacterium]